MVRGAALLLAPLLWIAAVALLPAPLRALPASLEGLLVAALLASPLVVALAVAVASSGLGERPAVVLGLVALAGLVVLGPVEEGARAALRGGLVLWAAGLLGRAFAVVLSRRWPEPHRLFPATVLLALFDLFSVAVGPARQAVDGGLLRALLVPLPAPGGGTPGFVGISDLIAVALLVGWLPRAVLPPGRVVLASMLGLWLALAQAWLTRGAAPALPWILGLVTIAAWPRLGVTAALVRRTARQGAVAALLLGVVAAGIVATRASPSP